MNGNESGLRRRSSSSREKGQTMTLVLLVLGLFLLAAVAFAVDLTNWWFHRQMARSAADAACTAGIMDMLMDAQGSSLGNFPAKSPPGSFKCSANTGVAMCKYASLNGYSAPGLTNGVPSNDVFVSFPDSVTGSGLSKCGATPVPPCLPASVANPFLVVNVIDRVQMSFSGLVSGSRTRDVAGSAACAITVATSPVPLIVLNPTCPHAFEISGSADVQIVGGPPRSIQVNSNNSCASATSSAANACSSNSGCGKNNECIDLSLGGNNFSGSDFAMAGGPGAAPGAFNPGSTGHWYPSTGIIQDPFQNVSSPAVPAASPTDLNVNPANWTTYTSMKVAHNVHGCPDSLGCLEFRPGLYTHPIQVKGYTAIFDPGVYYMQGNTTDNSGSPGAGCITPPKGQTRYAIDVDSNGVVRPADPTNNAQGNTTDYGVMFYLSGATGAGSYGSVFFGANAGKENGPGRTIDQFTTTGALCPGADPIPSKLNLPSSVHGNVLLGPCTSDGTYNATPPAKVAGSVRGLLFFQDRDNADANGQASMQGGGGLIISGNMYFHNCSSNDGAGKGTNCANPTSGYQAFYQLQGTSGGTAYVLGNITTDNFVLGGGGTIAMSLNPNAVYNILKATLIE